MAIIKLPCDGKDYYLEWSSVADAPTTFGMLRDEFESWYRENYGSDGLARAARAMERVESVGTSHRGDASAEETVRFNRAGKDETRLTVDQIVDHYIRSRPADDEDEPEPPMGVAMDEDEGEDQ